MDSGSVGSEATGLSPGDPGLARFGVLGEGARLGRSTLWTDRGLSTMDRARGGLFSTTDSSQTPLTAPVQFSTTDSSGGFFSTTDSSRPLSAPWTAPGLSAPRTAPGPPTPPNIPLEVPISSPPPQNLPRCPASLPRSPVIALLESKADAELLLVEALLQ